MKKTIKKLSAFFLTGTLILTSCFTAFAADEDSDDASGKKIEISVSKEWVDDDESDRPDEIEFDLYVNGSQADPTSGAEHLTLHKDAEWAETVNLTMDSDGIIESLEVREFEVPDGYSAGYVYDLNAEAGTYSVTITNTRDGSQAEDENTDPRTEDTEDEDPDGTDDGNDETESGENDGSDENDPEEDPDASGTDTGESADDDGTDDEEADEDGSGSDGSSGAIDDEGTDETGEDDETAEDGAESEDDATEQDDETSDPESQDEEISTVRTVKADFESLSEDDRPEKITCYAHVERSDEDEATPIALTTEDVQFELTQDNDYTYSYDISQAVYEVYQAEADGYACEIAGDPDSGYVITLKADADAEDNMHKIEASTKTEFSITAQEGDTVTPSEGLTVTSTTINDDGTVTYTFEAKEAGIYSVTVTSEDGTEEVYEVTVSDVAEEGQITQYFSILADLSALDEDDYPETIAVEIETTTETSSESSDDTDTADTDTDASGEATDSDEAYEETSDETADEADSGDGDDSDDGTSANDTEGTTDETEESSSDEEASDTGEDAPVTYASSVSTETIELNVENGYMYQYPLDEASTYALTAEADGYDCAVSGNVEEGYVVTVTKADADDDSDSDDTTEIEDVDADPIDDSDDGTGSGSSSDGSGSDSSGSSGSGSGSVQTGDNDMLYILLMAGIVMLIGGTVLVNRRRAG